MLAQSFQRYCIAFNTSAVLLKLVGLLAQGFRPLRIAFNSNLEIPALSFGERFKKVVVAASVPSSAT